MNKRVIHCLSCLLLGVIAPVESLEIFSMQDSSVVQGQEILESRTEFLSETHSEELFVRVMAESTSLVQVSDWTVLLARFHDSNFNRFLFYAKAVCSVKGDVPGRVDGAL